MNWRGRIRLVTVALIGFLPGSVKRAAYRVLFGYRIHATARIGLVILDAEEVDIGEGAEIGHLNLIVRVGRLAMGRRARIGVLNVIRGGESVSLGDYSTVMRLNVLNAIPDHDCTTAPISILEVKAGAFIVSGHRIDFTDRVTIGRNVIIGGRNSSLWTHNRQVTAPIVVGDFCYLGSEVRVAPGARLADESILALGAVLSGQVGEPRCLVAGVPGRVVRRLTENDLERIRRKTRQDIPDGFYSQS